MIVTIKKGCLLCSGDVKGNRKAKYYCKTCNILFTHENLVKAGKFPKPRVAKLIASMNSNKYHNLDCMCVKNIERKNRIVFSTINDAKKSKYKACGMCKP